MKRKKSYVKEIWGRQEGVGLEYASTGQSRGTSPHVRRKRTIAQGDTWYNSGGLVTPSVTGTAG